MNVNNDKDLLIRDAILWFIIVVLVPAIGVLWTTNVWAAVVLSAIALVALMYRTSKKK